MEKTRKKKTTGKTVTSNKKRTRTKKPKVLREIEVRAVDYRENTINPFDVLVAILACLIFFSATSVYDVRRTNALEKTSEEMIVETVEEVKTEKKFLHSAPVNYDDVLAEKEAQRANSFTYSYTTYSTANYVPSGSIIDVAMSQLGNVGGYPYWSWYGFTSWAYWCAAFTSWCANQCGYLDSGVCPRFSAVGQGVSWFISRGQWAGGSAIPSSGMYIFFDYDCNGMADHVGLVASCDGSTVYCVEGNYNNTVSCTSYPVGHYSIMGYGMPAY
ncbi:MAG: CHAP domain-containing protein [Erysipelotrichaceae bacterium]|nr:CHAP domain-containing protein [Erysipelotrichaceae bacterium]